MLEESVSAQNADQDLESFKNTQESEKWMKYLDDSGFIVNSKSGSPQNMVM